MHWQKQVDKACGIVTKASQYYATARTLYNGAKFLGTVVAPMIVCNKKCGTQGSDIRPGRPGSS